MKNYIAHYGIKRRSGRYPWGSGDNPHQHDNDIVFKKGSPVGHISTSKKIKVKENKPFYVYDKEDFWDSKVYENAFAYYKSGYGRKKTYDHSYEAVNDLVSPGEKERVQLFVSAFKERPELFKAAINSEQVYLQICKDLGHRLAPMKEDMLAIGSMNRDFTDEEIATKLYPAFNSIELYSTPVFSDGERLSRAASKDAYYQKVIDAGYNAIIDDNNRKIYNEVESPLIVLNGSKDIKEVGEAVILHKDEVYQGMRTIEAILNEHGKRLAL